MKKVLLGLGLLGMAVGYVACGPASGNTTGVKVCATDSDCGTDICNTNGHVCMPKCSAGADCPQTSKNCDFVKDASGNNATSQKVCQCQTAQLCGGSSIECNQVDLLCEQRCGTDSDCQGYFSARTCVQGQCRPLGGGPDAGSGGGSDAGQQCSFANQLYDCPGSSAYTYGTCPNNTVCQSCSGTVGMATDCNWGDACNNGGAGLCGPIGLDTCGRSGYAPAFNPANFGPLITSISARHDSTSDPITECQDGADKITITIFFSASNSGLTSHSTQADILSHVFYINSNNTSITPAFAHNYSGLANQTTGNFDVGLCGPTSITGGAVYLRDESNNTGNAACFNAN